jgi:tetratricopeptide (TPR) repeat protein
MKSLAAVSVLISLAGWAVAREPTPSEARSRLLHGNYEEAREIYETLARVPQHQVAASIGLSRCLENQGEYNKALQAIEIALQANPDSADLRARQAELLYLRGRWDEAAQAAEKALALAPGNFLARWIRGQVLRDKGDWKAADAELRWFVRTYTERSGKDNEVRVPEELLLVGLAGAENARWHKMADQFRIVLNDIFGDAIRDDKEYWPAEYQAGLLLLEKYNHSQALESFDKALAINPYAAEALVGKGYAALQKYETREAELFALRAIKINPNLPEARRLLADVHLMAGDVKAANGQLEAARKTNPRDENTLGRYAACLYLSRNQNAFDALVKEVTKYNPKPGIFYHTLGESLEQRKHYEAAESYYKKATQVQPWLPWPQNSLGLLYMRLGREKEAREVLSSAILADEFNVRVSNSIRVLRHLEKYETTHTEHFEIRFDPQSDRRLVRYMCPYLEEIYRQLTDKFHYQPPQPILIEVFTSHEMFSGRVIALPDLHTIGASSGRVVAIVSPGGQGIPRPFNWARVLRHELVHVFNLEQTKFQVPHWFTEGLAVIQEGFPRPQQWNELLGQRVPAGEIMNLDTIDLGFIRPRSPLDWHMAYCQSQLYIEYIIKRFGSETIGAMLSAYSRGLGTNEIISSVCHVDKREFEKGYRSYLDEVSRSVQSSGWDQNTSTYRQLQREFESKPDDPDLAARMAEQSLIRRDKKEARRLAEAALAKNSTHPRASYVKARLLMDAGEDDQARALLESALNLQRPDPKVLLALGKMYYESRDFGRAAGLYERARQVQPHEVKWLSELLRVHTQAGNKDKQIEVLKKLVPTDADDLDMRKRLGRMLFEEHKYAEAERYAKEALEIDVRDVEARETLLKSLTAQDKSREAERIRELLE